ncbi:MAG: hypothetical protein KC478_03690 [Bacteriovoracaceae bacterium]|nr:hypothetical protein [Bacteriovoracaceae bacterium]
MIIQSVMGGLQSGLIARSKKALGHGEMIMSENEPYKKIFNTLRQNSVEFYPEYEIELMAKKGKFISPVILHGVDFSSGMPPFLVKKDTSGIILGADLSSLLNAYFGSTLQFISPSHLDRLFGDVPRYISEGVSDFYMSELTEVDSVNAWTRASLVQNLVRKRGYNKIRFYNEADFLAAQKLFPKRVFKSWEQKNQSLVWALGLETNVMLFLFISMTLLVALCITSGFLIFFDKIKIDLMSLWVLGISKKDVMRLSFMFTQFLSLTFCLLGLGSALGLLYILSNNQINFMPEFFVERSMPVKITSFGTISSFVVPYLVASIFSYFSFSFFRKENESFIGNIRKIV